MLDVTAVGLGGVFGGGLLVVGQVGHSGSGVITEGHKLGGPVQGQALHDLSALNLLPHQLPIGPASLQHLVQHHPQSLPGLRSLLQDIQGAEPGLLLGHVLGVGLIVLPDLVVRAVPPSDWEVGGRDHGGERVGGLQHLPASLSTIASKIHHTQSLPKLLSGRSQQLHSVLLHDHPLKQGPIRPGPVALIAEAQLHRGWPLIQHDFHHVLERRLEQLAQWEFFRPRRPLFFIKPPALPVRHVRSAAPAFTPAKLVVAVRGHLSPGCVELV
mmetsp:Transcript_17876/g.39434  ORF Transcript_17876/g.39434 Transcript_17876/m.39434 type:complete len:270 (+) Transcript_17876:581-1390(+)